ncbi:Tumor protein p63-regulated gene 1-like protein [Merluccius polli]|uniref:Tumor protein p63-regulated gene 1-like protein n=1 Tax=Merluccius polli TaxID=89951 RepID=A0AA47MKM3_MERPO|nr:Tumor protein p63-regulated gene 1-like protein [Merluccius polli]
MEVEGDDVSTTVDLGDPPAGDGLPVSPAAAERPSEEAGAPPQVPPAESPSAPPPAAARAGPPNRWLTALDQFKMKRFFVLRPGTLTQAMEDIQALVDKDEDGAVQGLWLMAE